MAASRRVWGVLYSACVGVGLWACSDGQGAEERRAAAGGEAGSSAAGVGAVAAGAAPTGGAAGAGVGGAGASSGSGGSGATGGVVGEVLLEVEVRDDSGIDRSVEYAWSGVPIPLDADVTSTAGLALVDASGVPAMGQFRVLSRWGGGPSDASLPIQWLQVGVLADVPAGGVVSYQLLRSSSAADAGPTVQVEEVGSQLTIDTDAAQFGLDLQSPGLLTALTLDSRQWLNAADSGPFVTLAPADGGVTLGSEAAVVDRAEVVESGPLRVTVSQSGHFESAAAAATCPAAGGYPRFAYTMVLGLTAGQSDIDVEFNIRNECGSATGSPWTDEGVTISNAGFRVGILRSDNEGDAFEHTLPEPGSGNRGAFEWILGQHKGRADAAGWRRVGGLRRVDSSGAATDVSGQTGEVVDQATLGLVTAGTVAMWHVPWLRYREPQGIRLRDDGLEVLLVSEQQVIGEARGIWGRGLFDIAPQAELRRRSELAKARLERGLLVSAQLAFVNTAGVLPSLGNRSGSAIESVYRAALDKLHDDTVREGGQWEQAKVYGSQFWPDTQFDRWSVQAPNPAESAAHMNYWNPANAELVEFFRSGEPKWVWDMALPASYTQLYSAYYNIGDHTHGNRNGLAVCSGGGGDGHWNRQTGGSDDYGYNRNQYLAYVVRPTPMMVDRFRQAGATVVSRYSIPKSDEASRVPFTSERRISRQVVQHLEMLLNCAQFVPATAGDACRARLDEIIDEMLEDNLSAGVMCADDIPSSPCQSPQQFMQNAMMYGFFMRYHRYKGHRKPEVGAALARISKTYWDHGVPKMASGDVDVDGGFAARLVCELDAARQNVTSCMRGTDSDNNTDVYAPSKPHSLALVAQGQDLDPGLGVCPQLRRALEQPQIEAFLSQWISDVGYWKGANQMLQDLAFAVGVYDTCSGD